VEVPAEELEVRGDLDDQGRVELLGRISSPASCPAYARMRSNELVSLSALSVCQTVSARDAIPTRRDFLSIVSHEMRTPITVIVGLAATLADRRDHLTEEQVHECLEQIRHQGERLGALVADLLDLSQLEAGRFRVTLSPVELATAATLACEAAPPPGGTSVDFDIPADLWVVADSARLEQVLVNLLTNAYRYGGSAVRLEAHDRSDHVLLTLSDDGEGVPVEVAGPCSRSTAAATTLRATEDPASGLRSSAGWWRRSAGASGTSPQSRAAPASTSPSARQREGQSYRGWSTIEHWGRFAENDPDRRRRLEHALLAEDAFRECGLPGR
jgi:hypothetical protein